MTKPFIFATRPSALARWQTQFVISELKAKWPGLSCSETAITTRGDRVLDKPLPDIGGKGLFTYELELAILEERVDAAVHSLKDLPTDDVPGLIVDIYPKRADVRDVWICPKGFSLDNIPAESVVGTSSIRRSAQLLAYRPDLKVEPIRGNVDTRIRKVIEGHYDAIILAAAGVNRLGLDEHITHFLPFDVMLPAPGQGALGIQYRAGDTETQQLLKAIDHTPTGLAVTAERAFLGALGGGCSLPVGAVASVDGDNIQLQGVIAATDGSHVLRVSASGTDAQSLGETLAQKSLAEGAGDLLALVVGGK
jgi:hydroxymethylbilane synthase